jgi:hypothetical protein
MRATLSWNGMTASRRSSHASITEALRRAAEYGAAKMIEAAQALENSDDDRNNRISSTFCEFVGSDHHELELRRSTEAAIILMTSSTEAH